MITTIEANSLIFFVIAILAVLILAAPKPSQSAFLLLLQAIFANLFLIFFQEGNIIIGPSILLTLICLLMVCANFYFETSNPKRIHRLPKLNLLLGFFLLLFFAAKIFRNFNLKIKDTPFPLNFSEDLLPFLIVGFAFFAMLVSALTLFDTKNSSTGKKT